MKAYTDIKQSKRLAELLPIESADMWYWEWPTAPKYNNYEHPMFHKGDDIVNVPCWSLAALFKLLPKCIEGAEPSLIKTFRDDYRIVYDIHGDENITSEDYTNPIDACYEIILRLKENDLL